MKLLLLFGAVVYFITTIEAKPQKLITRNVQATANQTKENVTETLDENEAKHLLIKTFHSYHNGYFFNNGNNNENDKNQWHNEYKIFHLSYPLKANWFQAYEICKAKKWDLVMIDSQEKRRKVKEYLDTKDIDFKNFKNEIWTSGNDLGEEGSYIWMSTGKRLGPAELSFSIFDNMKHINPLGLLLQKIERENCLAVWNKFGHGLTLNDDDCFQERFFLCEKLNHHHHEDNDCDDDDNENASDDGESDSWNILDDRRENDESSENQGTWDMNDSYHDEEENPEENTEDSYFHNTSENKDSSDNWDDIS